MADVASWGSGSFSACVRSVRIEGDKWPRFAAATLRQWVFVVMSEYTLCTLLFPAGKTRTIAMENVAKKIKI